MSKGDSENRHASETKQTRGPISSVPAPNPQCTASEGGMTRPLAEEAGSAGTRESAALLGIGSKDCEQDCEEAMAPLDRSRVTARIKDLYKELLEAPIPEEWIRLVKAID